MSSFFSQLDCVPRQSKVDVARLLVEASARVPRVSYRDRRLPRVEGLVAAWLHPPRGRITPSTRVDIPWHRDGCLACQFADGDRLPEVARGDGDHRVAQPAVRQLLVAWHDDVHAWQGVPCPVPAWHLCHGVLEHVVDLTTACVAISAAVAIVNVDACAIVIPFSSCCAWRDFMH